MSIEDAIKAARAVAVTKEAEQLRNRSKGTNGTWTHEDERNLRAGFLRIWNPNARSYERLNIRSGSGLRSEVTIRSGQAAIVR